MVGSKQRPLTMYFVPSVDAQQITTTAQALADFVSDYVSKKVFGGREKFYVVSQLPTSYIAVIEAFGTGRADLAALNTFSYILAKDVKKYDVEAVLLVLREGGERSYKGQIIAHADSGIKSLADLRGKRFAFTDPASTSGYILPQQLFREKGVELGETVFAQRHDNVVTMVYQRQVDAGATYYNSPVTEQNNGKSVLRHRDARVRVATQYPDVFEKVLIIGHSAEIPNEPWVMRSRIFEDAKKNQEVKEAVLAAIRAFADTSAGKELLWKMYNIVGFDRTTDDDFGGIRQLVLRQNLDLKKALGP